MPITTLTGPDSFVSHNLETFLVPAGTTIAATGTDDGLTLDSCYFDRVEVKGTLRSADGNAILFDTCAANTVHVGAHGKLLSDGLVAELSGDANRLVNEGVVRGNYGAIVDGSGAHIENNGRLIGTGTDGIGCQLGVSNGASLDNTGLIRAGDFAVIVRSMFSTITNEGRIVGDTGVATAAAAVLLENRGEITGASFGVHAGLSMQILNSGTIGLSDPAGIAIQGGDFPVIVENRGLIDGDVAFGTAGDVLRDVGHGRITGLVDAGGGDDELIGARHAEQFEGGSGDDVLVGGGGKDWLSGGDGLDSLRGGSGDDRLIGGAGKDVLTGQRGDDRLTGGDGTDQFNWKLHHTGTDRVTDFTQGDDVLVLYYGLSPAEQADFMDEAVSHVGGHVEIDLGWIDHVHGTIVLKGFTGDLVLGDDIVFV